MNSRFLRVLAAGVAPDARNDNVVSMI